MKTPTETPQRSKGYGVRINWCWIRRDIGYRGGLPFTDDIAKEELCRGGRSVGFIAIVGVHKPVNYTLSLGELVQVNGVVYTVTVPGLGDGESARLILAAPCYQTAQTMKTQKAPG